jgi:molybdenum cofactor cytidylyltransferase
MKCSAILLAAGKSSRMGTLKGLLPWHGKTLIEHQVETLEKANVSEIIVVLGHDAEKFIEYTEHRQVKVAINKNYQTGKCSSIITGLHLIDNQSDALIILSVDQPTDYSVIKNLQNTFRENRHPIIIPTYQGKKGHPILFSKSTLSDLLSIKEETQGLRGVIQKYRNDMLEIPINNPLISLNLNTFEDYQKAIQI